jgi:hypothetical protein
MSPLAGAWAATLLLLAIAWRAAVVARAQLRRTQAALLALEVQAAGERAFLERLERELDRYEGEIATFHADVELLRDTYARVLRRYQWAQDGPRTPTSPVH